MTNGAALVQSSAYVYNVGL